MDSVGHGGLPGPVLPSRFATPVVLEALSRCIPPETIKAVLIQTRRMSRRIRRLPAVAAVWLVIGIGLWGDQDIPSIWRQVVSTLRSLLMVLASKKPPGKS